MRGSLRVDYSSRRVPIQVQRALADHAPVWSGLLPATGHVDLNVLRQIFFAVLKHAPRMIDGAASRLAARLIVAHVEN